MADDKPTFKLGQPMDEAFNKMSPQEIKDNLEAVMYGKEEGEYTKNLNEAELGVAKTDLADVSLVIARLEQKKKDFMAELKAELAEPKAQHKVLLETIKHKSIRKEGILWLVDDPENGMMYKFDENGICVDARPMLQSEKQRVLRQMKVANGDN